MPEIDLTMAPFSEIRIQLAQQGVNLQKLSYENYQVYATVDEDQFRVCQYEEGGTEDNIRKDIKNLVWVIARRAAVRRQGAR